jgi:hypothetical protein
MSRTVVASEEVLNEPVYWFVKLEQSLDDGRLEDALEAQRRLAELGVHVRVKRPRRKPEGPGHAA